MWISRSIAACALSVTALAVGTAGAQNYPTKPIRIVAAQVGSGGDYAARLVAQGISGPLGQPIVVDNRPSNLTAELVMKAPADGYTLLVDSISFWLAPLVQTMPYDPIRDFAPISLLIGTPQILTVTAALGVNTVPEFIAVAKAKPGQLNYASGSSGGSGHLTAELFKSMAGVNIVRIAYKGTVLAIPDLISGQVHMVFENPTIMGPHIKAGKVKALAVSTAKPTPLVPGVPPLAATLPGFDMVSGSPIFAPAKTPDAVIKRLNQEIVRLLSQQEVKDRLFNSGIDAIGSTPEELGAKIKNDMVRMGKVIKDAGIKGD